MSLNILRELPFYSLSDFEVSSMYIHNKWDLLENDTFVKYLADNKKNNEICQFDFNYFTETEFNQRYCNSDNCAFSVFHLKGHFTLWKKPLYRRLIVLITTF